MSFCQPHADLVAERERGRGRENRGSARSLVKHGVSLKLRYAIAGMVFSLLLAALVAGHELGLLRPFARRICGLAASEGLISIQSEPGWWCGGKARRHSYPVRQ